MKRTILLSLILIVVLMTMGMMQSVFAEAQTPEGYYYDETLGMTYKLDDTNYTASTYIYGTYKVDGGAESWTYNTSNAQVSIPNSITVDETEYAVTKIGEYTFGAPSGKVRGQSAATQNQSTAIIIPEGVTEFGTYAFYGCKKLTSIAIPSTVTTLGDTVFSGCGVLKEIDLKNSSITALPDKCFQNCYVLPELDLPSSIKSIHMNAFINARALAKIKINSDEVSFTPANDNCGFPAAFGIAPNDIAAGGSGKVPTVFYVKNETIRNSLIALAEDDVVSSNKTYDLSGIRDGSQVKYLFMPEFTVFDVTETVCAGEDFVFNIGINDKSGFLNTVKVLYDGEVVFEETEILKTEYTKQIKVDKQYVKQGVSIIEIQADDGSDDVYTTQKEINVLYAGISELVKSSSLTAGNPVTASFKLRNISALEKSIIVLYGIYDENDSLLKLSVDGKMFASNEEDTFLVSVDVPSDKDVTKLKAELYVWEGSFNFNPLMID